MLLSWEKGVPLVLDREGVPADTENAACAPSVCLAGKVFLAYSDGDPQAGLVWMTKNDLGERRQCGDL